MTNTIKFSQFVTASLNQQAATVVGVENGVNYKSQRFLVWTTATRPATPFNGLLGFNTDLQQYEYWDAVALAWIQLSIEGIDILSLLASHLPGEGASLVGLQNQSNVVNKTVQDLANAAFVVSTSNGSLQNQQVLGLLTSGVLKNTTATGILSISAPLTSIDSLVTVANQMIYTTAPNTYATTTLTPLARTLVSGLTSEAMRTTLGIAPMANGDLIIGKTGFDPVIGQLSGAGGITITPGPGTILITGSGGTVVSITAGTGLTAVPNPIVGVGTISLTTPVSLANGGTNAALVASNGGIVYSTATAFAILAGTATARQMLQSGASAAPAWSTSTWPATTTINQILFSSANNVVSEIATLASGALITSAGGVPSISQTLPTTVQGNITQLGIQSQALDMGSHFIHNVLDPTLAQDAATKNYVDQTALNSTSVYAASAASLGTVTQSGAGVGATLTNAGVQAVLALDGVNPPVGTNVLIKNTATGMGAANEGIYVVTNAGSGATNWVLTRATGYDTATEINNTGLIVVQNGSTLAGTAWYNAATIVTVDTTNFNFVRFGTTGTVTSIASGDTTVTLTPDPITSTGTVKVNTASFIRTVKLQVVTATGAGTYTPSAGMLFCIVELVGGGGQGGGSNSAAGTGSAGNGGCGAGYNKKLYTAANIGASASYSIGAGGTGAGAGAAGNNGGNSTFTPGGTGGALTSNGGNGGPAGTASASANATAVSGTPGSASGGDLQINGTVGGVGWVIAAGVIGTGGAGGTSALSTFTPAFASATVTAGQNAQGFGTGGGGAVSNGAGGAREGGSGSNGVLIITEFCNQ